MSPYCDGGAPPRPCPGSTMTPGRPECPAKERAMTSQVKAYNIFDLREMAMKRVPRGPFEFMDRGTEDEVSLRNNREVFERIRFKTRTFVDVSKRTSETTIFGVKHKMPLVI